MLGLQEILGSASEALMVIVKIALPALATTAAVGFAITIFQSVTRINEASLQLATKAIVMMAIIFVSAPAIYMILHDYMMEIFDRINALAPPP